MGVLDSHTGYWLPHDVTTGTKYMIYYLSGGNSNSVYITASHVVYEE